MRRFADLGCGAGVLTVLLLHALPQAAAVGVELQPDAAQLCRNNLEANGLTGRAQILCADLREHRAVLPAGSFDLVVANPPYFAAGSGCTSSSRSLSKKPDQGRTIEYPSTQRMR